MDKVVVGATLVGGFLVIVWVVRDLFRGFYGYDIPGVDSGLGQETKEEALAAAERDIDFATEVESREER